MPIPSPTRRSRALESKGQAPELSDIGPRTTLPVPSSNSRNDSPSPSRIPKFSTQSARPGNEEKQKPLYRDQAVPAVAETAAKDSQISNGNSAPENSSITNTNPTRTQLAKEPPKSSISLKPSKEESRAAPSLKNEDTTTENPKRSLSTLKPLGRSMSLRKPAEPSIAPRKQMHSRHASTSSTGSSKVSMPTAKPATTLKGTRLGTVSKPGIESGSSSSIPEKPTRLPSEPARPKSSHTPGSRLARPQLASAASTGPSAQDQPTRPAFTTHQQSFTPRKPPAPKPLTSSYLHPSTKTSSSSLSALPTSLAALQTHLLHLSLLHSASQSTFPAYTASALAALRAKHARLEADHAALRAAERALAEHDAHRVLAAWPPDQLPDVVAALSAALSEIDALTATGDDDGDGSGGEDSGGGKQPPGRFAAHADEFDAWVAEVERVWAVRGDRDGGNDNGNNGGRSEAGEACVFAPELPPAWHAAQASLTRAVTALKNELEGVRLPEAEGGSGSGGESSVERVVRAVKALVQKCAEELSVMGRTSRAVAEREREWADRYLDEMEFA